MDQESEAAAGKMVWRRGEEGKEQEEEDREGRLKAGCGGGEEGRTNNGRGGGGGDDYEAGSGNGGVVVVTYSGDDTRVNCFGVDVDDNDCNYDDENEWEIFYKLDMILLSR